MVSYTQWFEVVHESVDRRLSRQQRASLTSDLADYWQANKAELQQMTKTEARQLADQIVEC